MAYPVLAYGFSSEAFRLDGGPARRPIGEKEAQMSGRISEYGAHSERDSITSSMTLTTGVDVADLDAWRDLEEGLPRAPSPAVTRPDSVIHLQFPSWDGLSRQSTTSSDQNNVYR